MTTVVINFQMELRILKNDGWVTEDNQLTQKALDVLEFIEEHYNIKKIRQKKEVMGEDFVEKVAIYRELWPNQKLPTGVPARVNLKELEKKLTWFFTNYKFSWDTVLQATKLYIQENEGNGYTYMKNSGYFISKMDANRSVTSTLANYCDMILDSNSLPATTTHKPKIR